MSNLSKKISYTTYYGYPTTDERHLSAMKVNMLYKSERRLNNIKEQINKYQQSSNTNSKKYQIRNNYEAKKIHLYARELGLISTTFQDHQTENRLISMKISQPDFDSECCGCPCRKYNAFNVINEKIPVKYIEISKRK